MGKRIVIINKKGGAGKTTLSRMLIEKATQQGKTVLVVDLDPQANLTTWLGVTQDDIVNCNSEASHIFSANQPTEAIKTDFGCDLIPASGGALLEAMERIISGKELLLRKFLAKFDSNYDYVIVDTSPSIVSLTRSAVVACPNIVIPIETSTLGMEGTVSFLTQIAETLDVYECAVNEIHVVPTKYVKRQKDDNVLLEEIRTSTVPFIEASPAFGGATVSITEAIPQNSSIKEAPSFGVSPQVSLLDKRKTDMIAIINNICDGILE